MAGSQVNHGGVTNKKPAIRNAIICYSHGAAFWVAIVYWTEFDCLIVSVKGKECF